jgi:hypothetical protein
MQWSDVTKAPSPTLLRQFAGLWLTVFGGLAVWRWWHGNDGMGTTAIGVAALVIGGAGLVAPASIRLVYTGWMIVAFPIGWTVSRLVLGTVFFIVFTAVGVFFRLTGRDALRMRRGRHDTYWIPKESPSSNEEYLHQY